MGRAGYLSNKQLACVDLAACSDLILDVDYAAKVRHSFNSVPIKYVPVLISCKPTAIVSSVPSHFSLHVAKLHMFPFVFAYA